MPEVTSGFNKVVTLRVNQGSFYLFEDILYLNGKDGPVQDLTGYSLRGKVKKHPASATSIDITANLVVPAPATQGKWQIQFPPTLFAGLEGGKYVYDIELFPDGLEDSICIRIMEGTLWLSGEITD